MGLEVIYVKIQFQELPICQNIINCEFRIKMLLSLSILLLNKLQHVLYNIFITY